MVPAGGLSAASRLQCGVDKGNMTKFGCMGLWWYRPAWAGQTAVGGAKSGPGPPPGVKGQPRWAVVRVCEGGGAQHTHALGLGQVWVALHGGGMGGGNERKVVGWWAYLRPVAGLVVDPLASAGRWHLTWWVRGAAQGGRRAMW